MGFLSDTLGLITGATQKRRSLEQNGTPIEATLTEVRLISNITVQNRSPYQIIAQWVQPETNQLYTFKSQNIWYDPTPYVSVEHIKVLIDKGNPKRYLMDTSFLPKKA